MDVHARLIAAAARVYAESGYRGATTRRIAQVAGVNEVTLFRHFGSKASLLHDAIASRSGNGEGAALPSEPRDPRREVSGWARALMRHLTAERALIRTCMGEMGARPGIVEAAREQPERATRELTAYVRRLQAAGLARRDVDPAAAAGMLIGAVFSEAMSRDLMPELYRRSPEASAAAYARLLLGAIGAERAGRAGGAHQERNGRRATR